MPNDNPYTGTVKLTYTGDHERAIKHPIGARSYRAYKGATVEAPAGDVPALIRRGWQVVEAPKPEPAKVASKPAPAPKPEPVNNALDPDYAARLAEIGDVAQVTHSEPAPKQGKKGGAQ